MGLKTLLLNKEYNFDFDGNFHTTKEIINNNDSDLLNISIDGVKRLFNKKWLGLLAHYEVDLPLIEVLKITFSECKSKVIGLKCSALMVIKKPIIFEEGFRLIPGFPRFKINSFGVVVSRKSGRILKQAIGPYGYPYVNIYDPDKSKWRSVSTHILLARAFIKNHDPGYYCFINHKDGNKQNYSLNNLEWVCSRDNNKHAVKTGLRNDNIPCKVHDIKTDIVTLFPSINLALKDIGLVSGSKKISRNIGNIIVPNLFLNRFEIKLVSDTSNWYYSKINCDKVLSLKGPYQALNIITGKIIESYTIKGLVKETNISEDRILGVLRALTPKSCQNYTFRIKSNDAWALQYEPTIYTAPRIIWARNMDTSEILRFDSIRQLTAQLSIDKRTLKSKLHSKKSHCGWVFEEELCLL